MTNSKPAGDSTPRSFSSGPATRPAGVASRVQLRAATPDAVLAVVPHLLGFYPSRSLVVLGLGEQNRVVVTFRYDLQEPAAGGIPLQDTAADGTGGEGTVVEGTGGRASAADRATAAEDVADDIAEHASFVLDRERISAALLVGYGAHDLVAPVIATVAARLSAEGVELHEVLRAESGRYWSMLCDDPACCPPGGRSYDPGSHPAAAVMTAAGLAPHPDRDALARTLQRPAGAAGLISRATSQALLRLEQLVELGEADGDSDPQLRATRAGRREIQRAIRLYRSGGAIESTEHLCWLAVLLADLRVRDDAWARMDPAHRDQHRRLWTDVLRGAALDYVPAPASLLAFTAWQSGNGALASMAIDRALGADPGYSMAHLLAGAVEAALPPSAARMPMTPAAVAASYAGTGPRGRADGPEPGAVRPGARSGKKRSRSGKGRRRRRPAPHAANGAPR